MNRAANMIIIYNLIKKAEEESEENMIETALRWQYVMKYSTLSGDLLVKAGFYIEWRLEDSSHFPFSASFCLF